MSRTFNAITTAMSSTLSAMRSIKDVDLGSEFDRAVADVNNAIGSLKLFDDEMVRFTKTVENTDDEMMKFVNTVDKVNDGFTIFKGVAANAISWVGNQVVGLVNNFDDLIDSSTLLTARLDMINDGMRSTAQFQEDVFQAAQRSHTAYDLMAESVSKLNLLAGDTFRTNREALQYAELLGKSFSIAGADIMTMNGATRQLIQALGSGVLRGDELNSVFEAAPNIVQNIADHLKIPIGQIRAMAAEGRITSDILRDSMFAAANDINSQFEQMPMTIGQMWQSLQNEIFMEAQPFLQNLAEGARLIYDNIDVLVPIVKTLAVNFALVAAAMAVDKLKAFTISLTDLQKTTIGTNLAMSGVTLGLGAIYQAFTFTDKAGKTAAIVMGTVSLAVGGLTIAMWALNASMYANPIFLVAGIAAAALGGVSIITGLIRNITEETDALTDSVNDNQKEIDDWMDKINGASIHAKGLANDVSLLDGDILNISTTQFGAAIQAQMLAQKFSTITQAGIMETKSLKDLSIMYNSMNNLVPNLTKNLGEQDDVMLDTLSSLESLSGINLDNAIDEIRAITDETDKFNNLSTAIDGVTNSFYDFAFASAMAGAFHGKIEETAETMAEAIFEKSKLQKQLEDLTVVPTFITSRSVAEQYEDLKNTLQAEKLDELIAASTLPVSTYADLVAFAGEEQADIALAARGIDLTPEITIPSLQEFRTQLEADITARNQSIYDSQKYELKLGISELNRAIENSENTMSSFHDLWLDYRNKADSFGDMFKPLVDNGVLKVREQGEIKIDRESMSRLLDISTMSFKSDYIQLTPQLSINIENINENVDSEALINEISMQLTEIAQADLVRR